MLGLILSNAAKISAFKYNIMLSFCSELTNGFLYYSSRSIQRNSLRLSIHYLSKLISYFCLPCSFNSSFMGIHTLPPSHKHTPFRVFALAVFFSWNDISGTRLGTWRSPSLLSSLNLRLLSK